MKQIKDTSIEIRLTTQDKELLRNYAKKHGMTISAAIRFLCQKIFAGQDNEE